MPGAVFCKDGCTCKRHQKVGNKCKPGCRCKKHFRTQEHCNRLSMSVKLFYDAKKRQRD